MFPNRRLEHYFRQCEELLGFSGLSWWLIDLDDDPDIFYCNQTMCETFHLDPSITRHSVSETCPIAGDFNKFVAIKSSERAQKIFKEYSDLRFNQLTEYCNRFPYYDDKSEKVLYFSSRAKALVRNSEGRATLLFGIIEPEIASEELYIKASTDSLTGLKNRRVFDSQLKFLTNLAKREKRYISLILCDIDHFKAYNDSLGHYAGDECLITIAGTISDCCNRATDIVCRYGGEEFAVITYGDKDQVAELAEDIRQSVEGLMLPHPESERGTVTISAGYVSLYAGSETTPRALIEKADCGLYIAKNRGRNLSFGCDSSCISPTGRYVKSSSEGK